MRIMPVTSSGYRPTPPRRCGCSARSAASGMVAAAQPVGCAGVARSGSVAAAQPVGCGCGRWRPWLPPRGIALRLGGHRGGLPRPRRHRVRGSRVRRRRGEGQDGPPRRLATRIAPGLQAASGRLTRLGESARPPSAAVGRTSPPPLQALTPSPPADPPRGPPRPPRRPGVLAADPATWLGTGCDAQGVPGAGRCP